MSVLNVCRKPAVSVAPDVSVEHALELMTSEKVGAVVIVSNDKAAGILTRKDVIERVVLAGKPIDSTAISEVMTSPVDTLAAATDMQDAFKVMAKRPYNHLPVVDEDDKVVGLATTKSLMKRTIERLSDEIGSLESYIAADGIGG